MHLHMPECADVSETPASQDAPRALPKRRSGAPAPGEKRRKYLRWKRITTIALVVVVTALVVLLTGFFSGKTEDEDVIATRALLDDLGTALEAHHKRVGELPARLAELSNPNSPYRGDPIPEDAWGELIAYRAVDTAAGVYRLRSSGADQMPGTDDDLVWPSGTSWE